ncbi:MAG: hypothetical protein ABEJ60_01780 [Halodesulfurarchaeum sp.]
MANEDLLKPLKAINQTIAKLREDVQTLIGEVKKIPESIREATNTLRDAIHENIQAQAELKLMDHLMEVRSVKPQINAEKEQIENERKELESQLQNIDNRYRERQRELDEKAAERIRNLGEHIFEIDEEQFEAGIEDPFTEQVTTAWKFLQQHNDTVLDERRTHVRETTGEAVQRINEFVDRQDSLVEKIRSHRLEIDSLSKPDEDIELLHVPYYVVEYEKEGETHRTRVIPSQLSSSDDEWRTETLTPIPGSEDIFGGVPTDPPTDRYASLDGSKVLRAAEDIGTSSNVGVSFADGVEKSLPESEQIQVEVTEVSD